MRKKILLRSLLSMGIGLSMSSLGYASGFQLYEQDAASLGDYHAGYSINEDDSASSTFYNPAALTTLKNQQITAGVVSIHTLMRFRGWVGPVGTQDDPQTRPYGTANGGVLRLAPNGYYAIPFSNGLVAGIGVAAPFGLGTEYPRNSVAANSATSTEVEVVDVTPALGYKINPYVSVGAGLDLEYLTATFDNLVFDQLNVKNKGSSWGIGWHGGLFFAPDDKTRLGVSYHSEVKQSLQGHGAFEDGYDPGLNAKSRNLESNIALPAWTAVSGSRQLGSQWTLMGTVMYTHWSTFKNLSLRNLPENEELNPGSTTLVVPQNFKNTWNLALGAHFQINPKWMLRGGIGYDNTPTRDPFRNLRLPGENRLAFALGAQYNFTKRFKTDIGWLHLAIQNARINNNPPYDYGTPGSALLTPVTGSVHSYVNLFGLQLTYTFR